MLYNKDIFIELNKNNIFNLSYFISSQVRVAILNKISEKLHDGTENNLSYNDLVFSKIFAAYFGLNPYIRKIKYLKPSAKFSQKAKKMGKPISLFIGRSVSAKYYKKMFNFFVVLWDIIFFKNNFFKNTVVPFILPNSLYGIKGFCKRRQHIGISFYGLNLWDIFNGGYPLYDSEDNSEDDLKDFTTSLWASIKFNKNGAGLCALNSFFSFISNEKTL